ncbi:MAG: N-acetylmuramoyl-L-alanine amidase, family 2 [Frankiales bacterium]|nr:N-acetylmuramoyl-L-alanine amidase, family 2 [Frankiales bacterium]
MPRLLSSLVVLGAVAPAVIALPVATPHAATPHPVKATVARVALTSVAAPVSAAQGPALRRTALGLGATATKSFSTVGVTWQHDPSVGSVTAEVRWRSGGRWSAWRSLAGDSDDAPDAGSVDAGATLRDGTAPVWVGHGDGVQVRVTTAGGIAPRDVRVDLVDPGTSAADATVGTAPRDSATAVESQPPILTRADWGADESIRVGHPSYSATVKVGFVHHTDTANDYTIDQTAAVIRSIYAYHVKSNGWSDIGYNYLVDRFGRVWEGRYGGITRAVIGAHTGGFNVDSFGTSLIGTYSTVAPSVATLTSLERLFAWKLGAYYRDPAATAALKSAGGGTSRYAAGVLHTFAVVSGHRDAGNTTCPGDATYARMGTIRSAINGYLGTAFVDPTISATKVPLGSTTPVAIRSTARNAPAWTLTITTPLGAPVRSWTGAADVPITASWDFTDANGVPVPVGAYTVTLQGTSPDGDTALPWTTTVLIGAPQVPKGAWLSPDRYSTRFGSPAPASSPVPSPTPS